MQRTFAYKANDGLLFETEREAAEHDAFSEILLLLAPEKMHQDVSLRQHVTRIIENPAVILTVLMPLCAYAGDGRYNNKYVSISKEEPQNAEGTSSS